MPEIHRQDGFSFVVYPNDHRPAHVHVFHGGTEARIALGDDNVGPSLMDVKGMSSKHARRAVGIVEENQDTFLARWREIHG